MGWRPVRRLVRPFAWRWPERLCGAVDGGAHDAMGIAADRSVCVPNNGKFVLIASCHSLSLSHDLCVFVWRTVTPPEPSVRTKPPRAHHFNAIVQFRSHLFRHVRARSLARTQQLRPACRTTRGPGLFAPEIAFVHIRNAFGAHRNVKYIIN